MILGTGNRLAEITGIEGKRGTQSKFHVFQYLIEFMIRVALMRKASLNVVS